VFVVGHLGNWQRAAAVLFERHSLQGHSAPRQQTGTWSGWVFPCLTRRGPGSLREEEGYVIEACGRIRRLTPVECERLQGFPDSFTAIPWRGKPADQCPDGPRYKALGNSMAVPVMRWIGERIELVNQFACPPHAKGRSVSLSPLRPTFSKE
jgi:DNA (cytosine-5)-methyltransferase 1